MSGLEGEDLYSYNRLKPSYPSVYKANDPIQVTDFSNQDLVNS